VKLHLVALPHTQTTSSYLSCAYTQKVVKFCRMMEPRGWEIILYAGEENEAPCAEHVVCVSEEERRGYFGDGFDTALTPLSWDANEPYWRKQAGRVIAEMAERIEKEDLILLSTGTQALISTVYPHLAISCEPFVGYQGIATKFCAYESSSFMHEVYRARGIENGRDFDAVIPNFFDPDEFPILNDRLGGYLLYVGRMIVRKGLQSALEVAKATGMPLVFAGPGASQNGPGAIHTVEGAVLEGNNIEYVGEVGLEERAKLMAGAYAVLAPTQYLEPFGGVAVEAMFCGTPVITTDWGAYRETVAEGVVGYRYRTLREGVDAVAAVEDLSSTQIREYAISRYSLEAVAPQFERWFARLQSLWHEGWYQL
jgi:glycosyltransferase involved in cell wall biosynthesis